MPLCGALNSMLNSAERHFILSNISRYKFLYMSPEALSSPYVLNRLKNVPVSLFANGSVHKVKKGLQETYREIYTG